MFDSLSEVETEAKRLVDDLDPSSLTPGEAAHALAQMATASKVLASGVTMLAQRAGLCPQWRQARCPDVGSWVATQLGCSVTDGRRLYDTSRRLPDAPDTREAMAAGTIAPLQAAEVLAARAAAIEATSGPNSGPKPPKPPRPRPPRTATPPTPTRLEPTATKRRRR